MKITKTGAIWLGIGLGIIISGTLIYTFRKDIKNVAKEVVNYAFSKEQESFIKDLHPKYQDLFRRFIYEVEKNTNYKVLITSGFRSFAKQAQLHLENPSNAKAGSLHNFGLAIDINLVSKKDGSMIMKASSDSAWEKSGVLAIAKNLGLQWGGGGRFGSYDDRVHFQAPLSGSKLYADAIKQFGSEKNVIGNRVNIS